jgi:hypothetical protein
VRHERRRHDRVGIACGAAEIRGEVPGPVGNDELEIGGIRARDRARVVVIDDDQAFERERPALARAAQLAYVVTAVTSTADDDEGAYA